MIQLATVQIAVDGDGGRQVKLDTRPADPDAADVVAASGGDLAAAERLYRRHQARVTHVARILTGNSRDAEDICQETFVRALDGLSGFRGEAAFSSWLYRIAINQARNLLAKEQVRQRLQAVEPDDDSARPSQRPVAELRIALLRAMARLSQGQREVVICHDVLGMKHEEIAFVLGCAPGTSKAQLHRARIQLRALLGGNGTAAKDGSGHKDGERREQEHEHEHERRV